MFVKTTGGSVDQYPYTVENLRRDNPTVSFPLDIPTTTLLEYGLAKVRSTTQPDFDRVTQYLKEVKPALQDGVWVQVWSVETRLDVEVRVRKHRDDLLTASDWTQVADAPVDQAGWAVYRQSLRDVPAQESFPEFIDWPVKP